jgi:hypothetical protein
MRKSLKYFLAGLLFFSVLYFVDLYFFPYFLYSNTTYQSILLKTSNLNYYFYFSLIACLAIPAVMAIGFLKTPKQGLAFALASFAPWLFGGLAANNYYYLKALDFSDAYRYWPNVFSSPTWQGVLFDSYISVVEIAVIAVVTFGLFSYLPAKIYSKNKTFLAGFIGFVIAFVITTALPLIIVYPSTESNFFYAQNLVAYDNTILLQFAFTLLLGCATLWLCLKRLKTPLTHPLKNLNPLKPKTCSKCSVVNPAQFEFCGACGNRLQSDDTKIY